jgi:radical SAM superfamily enzyme YgiQ (UPF0313 family)
MPSVHFIHAPEVYYEQNAGTRFVPVWVYTLAAYVPDGWRMGITDCTIAPRSAIPDADVYVFSGINQDLPSLVATLAHVRAHHPSRTCVLGGPIVWSHEQCGKLADLDGFDHLFVLDGEETFPDFLRRFAEGRHAELGRIIRAPRFDLSRARMMRFDLLAPHVREYYGGVVEAARGCPFLCEFCDIRVLPDNNRVHSKDIDLIVREIDAFWRLGVRQIQIACDNFIGDQVWARKCTDAILEWALRTRAEVALYTWCTINISRFPELLGRMRRAGFNALFIGVESFNANSILETAKVQNKNDRNQMVEALQKIQSFGFIVVPGLIFGFDSDPPSMFDDTLRGVHDAGLIAGDPTFLLALPGTPLYARMKRAGRLVEDDRDADQLELHRERVSKVESNIKYLQPRDAMVRGFMRFIARFTDGDFAYRRFRRHVELVLGTAQFRGVNAVGYGNLAQYLKSQFSSRQNVEKMANRMRLLLEPKNFWAVTRAYALVVANRRRYPGLKNHFTMWLYVWTNLLLKYRGLREEDFRLHSVESGYDLERVWREIEHVEEGLGTDGRNHENVNVGAQLRSTQKALARLRGALGKDYSLSDFQA